MDVAKLLLRAQWGICDGCALVDSSNANAGAHGGSGGGARQDFPSGLKSHVKVATASTQQKRGVRVKF